VRWLMVIQARHCRGADAGWSSLLPSTPPAPPVAWQFDGRPAGDVGAAAQIPISLDDLPPLPPPRGC